MHARNTPFHAEIDAPLAEKGRDHSRLLVHGLRPIATLLATVAGLCSAPVVIVWSRRRARAVRPATTKGTATAFNVSVHNAPG